MRPERTDATISECGKFRYRLVREWDPSTTLLPVVMLNPSTADAEKDDATVRRCRTLAKRERFGGLLIVNLYAYRTRWPKELKQAGYPIGPSNDTHLVSVAEYANEWNLPVVAAWGANAPAQRTRDVMGLMLRHGASFRSIGLPLKGGQPQHPLMTRNDARLLDYP